MADLFELSAKLGLDIKEYEDGLIEAKSKTDKILGKIGKKTKELSKKAFKGVIKASVGFVENVFEHGLALDESIGAVYALTDAEDELAKKTFEATVLQEAMNSAFDASQVAEAGMYEALAGYELDEVTAGLHGLIVTAEAAGESLEPVSDILTDLITTFGEASEEQLHYGDVLAATATNSNTTILKMGQTLKYVAPVAASLGYSIEDVSIAIGVLADQAIKGSQAGTSLRNIMTRIATNAGATENKLGALDIITEKLGVNFYDTYGNARPFLKFLTDVRKAWNGMSGEDRNAFFGSFGDYKLSIDEADEALLAFQEDVKTMSDLYTKYLDSGKKDRGMYEAQINKLAGTYKELFESLNIDFGSSPREWADAMEKASAALGVMNDEEQISYANQIGSLRAMASWLALMNIEQGKFEELSEDIYNSEGAAERMRERRYENLSGDIKYFNAAADALYDLVFLDWKAPMRDIVQYGTSALRRISQSVETDGFIGGIRQFGTEINDFIDNYSDEIKEFGNAIVPVLTTLVDTVMPAFAAGAVKLGFAFAAGVLTGIKQKILDNKDNILDTLTFGLFRPNDVSEDVIQVDPIGDTVKYVQDLFGWNGGAEAEEGEYTIGLKPIVDTEALDQQFAEAGAEGGDQLGANLPSPDELFSMYPSAISSAIADGGAEGAALAASYVQDAISGQTYTIDIIPNIVGMGGGLPSRIARFGKAMSSGYVMNGATVFGMDNKGQPMVGGEAGQEAVVGTNSLNRMIQASVAEAMNGVLSRLDAMVSHVANYAPKIYLDTGALVGGTVNGMNSELNDVARWKGYGRV